MRLSMFMPSVNRQSLESLLKLGTKSAVIGLAVAALLLHSGRVGAVEAEPSPATGTMRARWTRQPKDPVIAEQFSRALFLEGKREDACRVLITTLGSLGDPSRRAPLEERVRVISRSFIQTESARLYQAGLNLLAEGKLSAAEERFSNVLSKEPGLFDALVRRGQVRWLQSNEEGALEDFRHAWTLNPFERELRIWMGLVEIRRGARTDGARQILQALGGSSGALPESVPPSARRNAFYRASYWAALWASGREELVQKQMDVVARAKGDSSRPPASWIWEHLLATPMASPALLMSARRALQAFPKRQVETDGPSGIALQWWDPERLAQALQTAGAEPSASQGQPQKPGLKSGG